MKPGPAPAWRCPVQALEKSENLIVSDMKKGFMVRCHLSQVFMKQEFTRFQRELWEHKHLPEPAGLSPWVSLGTAGDASRRIKRSVICGSPAICHFKHFSCDNLLDLRICSRSHSYTRASLGSHTCATLGKFYFPTMAPGLLLCPQDGRSPVATHSQAPAQSGWSSPACVPGSWLLCHHPDHRACHSQAHQGWSEAITHKSQAKLPRSLRGFFFFFFKQRLGCDNVVSGFFSLFSQLLITTQHPRTCP
jgi:hypothetical protein